MPSCDWTTSLSAYHDGELSAVDSARVEEHLATCQECRRELGQYRRLSLMLGKADIPELSSVALANMKRRIDWEGNLVILRLARRMTGVAAAVLLAGMLWLVTASSSGSAAPSVMNDWEAAAVSPSTDTVQQNSSDVQLAEFIETDLSSHK